MVTRDNFIDLLRGVKDLNAHYGFIDNCAAHGDAETLRALYGRIVQHGRPERAAWAPLAILSRMVEALAFHPGFGNARAAMDLSHSPAKLREVASRIVASQPSDVIGRLLADDLDLEASALILHEAVARRRLPAHSAGARETSDRLAAHGHPLSALPPALLDIERRLELPIYGLGTMGVGMPFGPYSRQGGAVRPPTSPSLSVAEATTPERADAIAAAVKNWADESNGTFEARTFSVVAERASADIAAILPHVGLACVGPRDALHLAADQSPEAAFAVLFSAAASGGAYNRGEFAAYGRLRAWRSLAGLMGAPVDAPFADLERRARDRAWCLFSAANAWYWQVAWDIGIACADPAMTELAVLAATDTD